MVWLCFAFGCWIWCDLLGVVVGFEVVSGFWVFVGGLLTAFAFGVGVWLYGLGYLFVYRYGSEFCWI